MGCLAGIGERGRSRQGGIVIRLGLLLLVCIFYTRLGLATTSIPEVTFFGPVSEGEKKAAIQARAVLQGNLEYWLSHGHREPPPLESIIYIPHYRGLKLREVLQKLNPDIPDVLSHIRNQYTYFMESLLADVVTVAEYHLKEAIQEGPDDWREAIFEIYAFTRYGFSANNLMKALEQDLTIDALAPAPLVPHFDNAFYARFHKIDLNKFLTPRPSNAPSNILNENVSWGALIRLFALDAININAFEAEVENTTKTNRIVILPRTHQGDYDESMSTLCDVSVVAHEWGHHMQRAYVRDGTHCRIIDEVLADYFSASETENPLIGTHFAKATELVLDRMEDQNEVAQARKTKKLKELVEKGFIRDLGKSKSIDELSRTITSADPYESGAPLRSFLWKVRTASMARGYKHYAEATLVAALEEHSLIPRVHSHLEDLTEFLKSSWQKGFKHFSIQQRAQAKAKAEGVGPEDFLKRSPKARTLKLEAEDELLERWRALDSALIKWRSFWQKIGIGRRPLIAADTSLAEFFRSYWRAAQNIEIPKSDPWFDLIRSEAEQAMNSSSVLIEMPNGKTELVFVRTKVDKLNFLARLKLKSVLLRIEALRAESSRSLNKDFSDDGVVRRRKFYERYGIAIAGLQEYERTGSTFSLFVPYPVMRFGIWFLDTIQNLRDRSSHGKDGEGRSRALVELYKKVTSLCSDALVLK